MEQSRSTKSEICQVETGLRPARPAILEISTTAPLPTPSPRKSVPTRSLKRQSYVPTD